jgi:hypothetical protein
MVLEREAVANKLRKAVEGAAKANIDCIAAREFLDKLERDEPQVSLPAIRVLPNEPALAAHRNGGDCRRNGWCDPSNKGVSTPAEGVTSVLGLVSRYGRSHRKCAPGLKNVEASWTAGLAPLQTSRMAS